MNLTNATNQMGSTTNGVATGVAPNFAAPTQGLNDDWLLDDSTEKKEEQINIPAFKESAPGEIPEENHNVDLIAVSDEVDSQVTMPVQAAIEELSVSMRDLDLLKGTIAQNKGMNLSIAMECNELMPGFIDADVRPMGYFTVNTSKTMLKEALEAIDEQEQGALNKAKAKLKEYIARFLAFLKSIGKRIASIFSKEKKSVEDSRIQIKNAAQQADVRKTIAGGGQQQQQQAAPGADAAQQKPAGEEFDVNTANGLIKKHLANFDSTLYRELPQTTYDGLEGEPWSELAVAAIIKWPTGGFFTESTNVLAKIAAMGPEGILGNIESVNSEIDGLEGMLKSVNRETVSVQSLTKYIDNVSKNKSNFGILSRQAMTYQDTLAKFYDVLSNNRPQASSQDVVNMMKLFNKATNALRPMNEIIEAVDRLDARIRHAFDVLRVLARDQFKNELEDSGLSDKSSVFKTFLDALYADK